MGQPMHHSSRQSAQLRRSRKEARFLHGAGYDRGRCELRRHPTVAWASEEPILNPDTWRWTDEQGVQRAVSTDELRRALVSGVIPGSALVWRHGMEKWVPAWTL